jgi:hypothetical protein
MKGNTLSELGAGLGALRSVARGLGMDDLARLAALIATLILGYPTDVSGLVGWLAALLALVHSKRSPHLVIPQKLSILIRKA